MKKYWVLSVHWPDGAFPNDELYQIVADKAGNMMLAGQMVLGTLGTREYPLGVPRPDGTIPDFLPDWRRSWKKNAEPPTIHDVINPSHGSTKHVRIFTSEAAASEFADFVLGYGADQAFIMTDEEVEALCPLPDEQYIDRLVVDPSDTQRIATLQSKIVTIEMMRYFREHGTVPPGAPSSTSDL